MHKNFPRVAAGASIDRTCLIGLGSGGFGGWVGQLGLFAWQARYWLYCTRCSGAFLLEPVLQQVVLHCLFCRIVANRLSFAPHRHKCTSAAHDHTKSLLLCNRLSILMFCESCTEAQPNVISKYGQDMEKQRHQLRHPGYHVSHCHMVAKASTAKKTWHKPN